MDEHTGLPSSLRAMTLSAWTATMKRLLESIVQLRPLHIYGEHF
jgi:hypothetical protein